MFITFISNYNSHDKQGYCGIKPNSLPQLHRTKF
ncbi:hypothetical protein T07_13474 [Trichinella nelsoni]|uniref:Uncharacterized protein n=1 Tax=Trichinella nelsoni TaxID=6336 RepID=A0A0V0RBH9_9BILA|nr:hypothetical protein T07_13474 [Trichinella nelsoni]